MFRLFHIKKEKDHAVFNFLNFKIKFKIKLKKKYNHPVIVLYGPVGIGDYMLYRPYFKYIKMSPKYRNASVIYIGRNIYNDFVNLYDSEYFDEIIDYDISKFRFPAYKKHLIKRINSYNPDVLFSLIPIIFAAKRMNGFVSMFKNVQAKDKYIGYFDNKKIKSKVFNHLIKYSDSSQYLFELQRAKKEFEQFLGIKIQDDTSELRVPFEKGCKYIAISYFSSGKDRMLSSKKWAQIINYCIEKTDDKTYFLFLGAKSEKNRLTPLLSKINNKKRCINMAGKLSISMIPFVLKSCDMLLSVESGNVHIAHSIGCKTLCFSGSGAYKRFHPYNDDIVKYIYPDKFQELVDKNSKEIEPIGYLPIPEHLKFSVNEINIDRVKCELDSLFSKTKTCV